VTLPLDMGLLPNVFVSLQHRRESPRNVRNRRLTPCGSHCILCGLAAFQRLM